MPGSIDEGLQAWHVILALFVFFFLSPTMTMTAALIAARAYKRMDLLESAGGLAAFSIFVGFGMLALFFLAGAGKTYNYNAFFWFLPFILSGLIFSLLAFIKIEKLQRVPLEVDDKEIPLSDQDEAPYK